MRIQWIERILQTRRRKHYSKYPYSCYVCKKEFKREEIKFNKEQNRYEPIGSCCSYQVIQLRALTDFALKTGYDCQLIDVNSPLAKEGRVILDFDLPKWEKHVAKYGLRLDEG